MQELMAWMQDGDTGDESDVDPLLALADQVDTQATPAVLPSQQASSPLVSYRLNHPILVLCQCRIILCKQATSAQPAVLLVDAEALKLRPLFPFVKGCRFLFGTGH